MKNKQTQLLWLIVCLLIICAWIFGLFIDLTGDAGLYATISRQMVESGDWLNLSIHGSPYDQKPHLFFWLAGAGIELWGNTNFGFRFFLLPAGASGIYFTYRLGRLLYSDITGKLAALFLATSQIYFLYFMDYHTDTVLQAAVVLSLWQFAEYLKRQQLVNFLIAFSATGLAMLTKGPVGAVLPFFFIAFYLLLTKQYRQFLHIKWIIGVLLSLLVISPVLYHLWTNFGAEGISFYFIHNNLGRVSGEVAGSSTDPFFYLYNLLWAFLPWTVPVVAGMASEIRSWFRGAPSDKYSASITGSVLVLLIIYSVARGKAPNYLMLLIPPMTIVAASRLQYFKDWPASWRRRIRNVHAVVLVIMFLLMLLLLYVVQFDSAIILLILIVTGAGLTWIYVKSDSGSIRSLVFVSVIIAVMLNLFLNISVLPELFRYQGARQALHLFRENRSDNGTLKNLQLDEYELFYWTELPVEPFITWEEFYEYLETDEPWVYTNKRGLGVVEELTSDIDSVFIIRQRGMNRINLQFLNPATRSESLEENFLIKVK